METKRKGDIAEQAFILAALQRGFSISRPIGDRLPYDCIVDCTGRLYKVQIKSAYISKGKTCPGRLCSPGARNSLTNKTTVTYRWYALGDFDVLATYDPRDGGFFIIPGDLFIAERRATLYYTWRTQRVGNPNWALFKDNWKLFDGGDLIKGGSYE